MTDRKRVIDMPLDQLENELQNAISLGRVPHELKRRAWGFIRAKSPKQHSIDWARAMVRELRRPDLMGPLIDDGDA